ncbi:MAG: aldo/keto reductase [Bryobacteraceae bacterium]
MQYRTLGKTGLSVSALSLGGSPLGGVFGAIDEAEGIRAVHMALDLGINYIDTSPFYGLTRAESVLGKALRGIPRDRFLVATKIGRYGPEEFDFSAGRTAASVEESLRRLGVDVIDVIQCHDMEFGSLDQIVGETLPALRLLREQGKVRFIGLSGLPLKIFRYVLDRTEADTIISYCHYGLNDTSLAQLLPYLEEHGAGVIHAAPLAMGLLTDRGAPPWHPAPEDIKAACAKAAAHCRRRNANIAGLALQFALANPRIHTVVTGTADPQEVSANLRCAEESMDEELLREVQTILAPVRNKTWQTGRPENN